MAESLPKYNDNEGNIEMLLRSEISVSQLSIYGSLGRNVQRIEQQFVRRFGKLRNTLCKRNIKDEAGLKMQDARVAETRQSL